MTNQLNPPVRPAMVQGEKHLSRRERAHFGKGGATAILSARTPKGRVPFDLCTSYKPFMKSNQLFHL